MKLFCREEHSEPIAVERNLDDELLEARAHLAKLKRLPISAFTEKSYKGMRMTSFGPLTYSVDNKDDAIARADAKIAELEVLTNPNISHNKDIE